MAWLGIYKGLNHKHSGHFYMSRRLPLYSKPKSHIVSTMLIGLGIISKGQLMLPLILSTKSQGLNLFNSTNVYC